MSIPYGKQDISEDDIKAVAVALQSDFLTQGPLIAEFERAFASYVGSRYAVAVSNGTAALHLSALVLGVSENSNVITTPITFAASANCVRYCGGNVFFADITPVNYLIDLNRVEELIKSKPAGFFSGVIPVDFAGRAVNLQELRFLSSKYNFWILEDACHAPGGYFVDGNGCSQFCGNGSFAEMAVFSFHPVKHIACGEGGMVTTNDRSFYEKLLLLRTHGITRDTSKLLKRDGGWYYEMQELGYNYRLTDFQSALGISQLKKATAGLDRRREIAAKYENAFADSPFIYGQSGIVVGHAYHLYVLEVKDRLSLYNYLREFEIFTQIHYIPCHLMPYYKKLGWKEGDMPNAENYYSRCISLPMYSTLTPAEQEFVIHKIFDFYNG